MAQTVVGLNDPKAVKKWGATTFAGMARESYFARKFMGRGADSLTPIQILTDLEKSRGQEISYDLVKELEMTPVEAPNTMKDKEDKLEFATDTIKINQMRGGVNVGGKMDQKRTLHDLRTVARGKESRWWGRVVDELFFMYLSGARGINKYVFPLTYTGFAGNALAAPDTDHQMYGKAVTSKAALAATDTLTVAKIDQLVTKAEMMNEESAEQIPEMSPIMIEGERHYLMLIDPYSAENLKTDFGAGGWGDIQKALATAEGKKSGLFTGALGMHNNVIIHSHRSVVRFSDYGAGSNVLAARNLFMGAQAAVIAYGAEGDKNKIQWHEETEDRGDKTIITTESIFGIKKSRFQLPGQTARDLAVIAVDVAAAPSY